MKNKSNETGKIKVSATQLKRFKITAENCDIFMRLEYSTSWLSSSNIDVYVNELLAQDLKFQLIREVQNEK